MLAFLASVSLALLRDRGYEQTKIDPKDFWQSGISPGDWKELTALCSDAFASDESNTLTSKIRQLNIRSEKKGFGRDALSLIREKNNYKHDRGPTVPEDIREASEKAQNKLRRCMEELSFFMDYPIRQVEDFDVSRRGDGVLLKCLKYTGDHPSFPQEEILFHEGLPKGDLFLDLGAQDWVPLYPFIVTMNCAHCKVKETYFIDLWDQKRKTARMKSFERGHTMANGGVYEALTEWREEVQQSTV